jgi:hypothetical protein
LLKRKPIFAKQKTNKAEQAKHSYIIEVAKEIMYATFGFIHGGIHDGLVRAAHRRVFMLCCAASAIVTTPTPLKNRPRLAHGNSYEHACAHTFDPVAYVSARSTVCSPKQNTLAVHPKR